MAIVWIDGFDHYTAAQVGRKYNSGALSSMTTGRYGGQAPIMGSGSDFVEKIAAATSQAWRIGLAVRLTTWNNNNPVIYIRDGVTNQVELGFSNSRQVRITRNGTQIGVSTATLDLNTWHYVEWYVVIADSIGVNGCVARLNNVEVLNLAPGTDTKNTANAFADRVVLAGAGSTAFNIDDFVISQEGVTTSPTFLGERRVATLYPSGNGNFSQFVGSDGNSTDNYQLVDEAQINDADYVTGDTAGIRDSYAMGDLSFTPTNLDAVQISGNMRKDDAGSRSAKLFFRIGSTNYDGSSINVSASYRIETYLATSNPATASAWTNTDVNAMEVGVTIET